MEKNYRSWSDQETEQERFLKEEAYIKAQYKVKKIMGFYRHLFFYVVINIFLIILITSNSNVGFWSFATFSTPLFWGIGLGFHALGVFGPDLVFGKSWEKRMIKKYMDKEKHSHWE
jgi:hypothetical protein